MDVVHTLITHDCTQTGCLYPMIINNALLVPSIDFCFIKCFIMRLAGVQVDECPKFLSLTPSVVNHSIYIFGV